MSTLWSHMWRDTYSCSTRPLTPLTTRSVQVWQPQLQLKHSPASHRSQHALFKCDSHSYSWSTRPPHTALTARSVQVWQPQLQLNHSPPNTAHSTLCSSVTATATAEALAPSHRSQHTLFNISVHNYFFLISHSVYYNSISKILTNKCTQLSFFHNNIFNTQ